jgi:hypothetical protein
MYMVTSTYGDAKRTYISFHNDCGVRKQHNRTEEIQVEGKEKVSI